MRVFKIVIFAITLISSCLNASAVTITHSVKPKKVSFRIVAQTEKIPKSGFSPNRSVYAAEVAEKGKPAVPAKIVYRYLGYEDDLPDDFLLSHKLHTFVAVRDWSCDESFKALSTKIVFRPDGANTTVNILRYITTDILPDWSDAQVLPCYVVRPRDYRGSREIKSAPPKPEVVQGQ